MLVQIGEIHTASHQTYGSPRTHAELTARGIMCSLGRVASIMRAEGIRARRRRPFRTTTDSSHKLPVASNILGREFARPESESAWAADITYVPTREGWLYLATVMDLHSRRIVGWALQGRITGHLTLKSPRYGARGSEVPPVD